MLHPNVKNRLVSPGESFPFPFKRYGIEIEMPKTNFPPFSIDSNRHLPRLHAPRLLILRRGQLLLQKSLGRLARFTPRPHIRLEPGLELEEGLHHLRRRLVVRYPHQPAPLVRNHIVGVTEQLPSVRRVQPRCVGLSQGILLPGEGG